MVRLTIILHASPRGAQELADALRFLMVGTRLEPGFLGSNIRVDADSKVQYEEEWTSEADMRRRVQSERFVSLLAVMESVPQPPEVRFDFLTASRGLDYIAEVREAGGARTR